MSILKALLVSEIVDWGYDDDYDDYIDDTRSINEQLRDKHPGLKEAHNEYIEAKHKHKYDMLLKLVKVTDKF